MKQIFYMLLICSFIVTPLLAQNPNSVSLNLNNNSREYIPNNPNYNSNASLMLKQNPKIQAESFKLVPTPVDFGKKTINASHKMTVGIANTGDSTLIQNFHLLKNKVFFIETDVADDIVLDTADTTYFTLIYIPTQEYTEVQGNADVDSIIITTYDNRISLPVRGQGIAPRISVEDWDAGIVSVGSTTCITEENGNGVKVTNTGTADLTINKIVLPNDLGPYDVSLNKPALPVTIKPGNSLYFEDVCLTPTESGTWNFNIVFSSNGFGPDSVLKLTATAKFNTPYVTDLKFNKRRALAVHDSTIIVKNAGDNPVTVTGVRIEGNEDFEILTDQIDPPLSGGVQLEPETSQQGTTEIVIPIRYTPSGETDANAEVYIEFQDQAEISSTISGSGFIPKIEIINYTFDPTPLDTITKPTGDVEVHSVSESSDLYVYEVKWADDSKDQTTFTPIGDLPKDVVVTEEVPLIMKFQFSPTSAGQKVAHLLVVSDRGPGPEVYPQRIDTITLSGLATGLEIIYNSKVNLHPNPAANYINISDIPEIDIYNISIVSITGETVAEFKNENYNEVVKLDISKLSPGTYFINIKGKKYQLIEKFIKE